MKYKARMGIDQAVLIFEIKERCHGKSLLLNGVHYSGVLRTENKDNLKRAIDIFISQNEINDSPIPDQWYFQSDHPNGGNSVIKTMKELHPKLKNFISHIANYYENLMERLCEAFLKEGGSINDQILPDNLTLEQAFLIGLGISGAVNRGLKIRHPDIRRSFNSLANVLDEDSRREHQQIVNICKLTEHQCLHPFYQTQLYILMKNDYDFDIANIESCATKTKTQVFLEWAVLKGFIKEIEENRETTSKGDRSYPEWLAKELHKQLTEQGLISGDYDLMWQWLPKRKNTLPYLSDRLSKYFKEECPLNRKQPNLTAYIKYSGTDFRKVSETTDRVMISKIDTVIQNLLSKEA